MKLLEDNYNDKREYKLTCPNCKSTYRANRTEFRNKHVCKLCYWEGTMEGYEILEPPC